MNPDDLIHAAPVMAKGAAALGAAIPFTAIVKRMLGPAADEVAEMWRDQVRVYRYERQLKLLEKAEQMATEAGFAPQPVPPKILFPLLEGASFEDNEDLHTMWAALLANAASAENGGQVRPGFIAILKQMAPDEAELLNAVADVTGGYNAILPPFKAPSKALLDRAITAHYALQMIRIREIFVKDGEDETATEIRWQTCVQILESAGLIWVGNENLTLSALGGAFLEACRPPKHKA